jgi:L-ascorbate metabolism protein UlaG (beta-lactamase superfamily)
VPTNIREWGTGGTRYAGNSIFVFEAAGLCIAHLSHLHHTLTEEHLKQLGPIDIALVPVDGLYTMPQSRAVEVVEQIKPKVVIPQHVFTPVAVEQFIAILGNKWPVKRSESATAVFSRDALPERQLLVLSAPYR